MKKGIIEKVVLQELGEDSLEIVRAMKGRKNFSEFKLADKVGRTVNETRNVLYKLNSLNLATFTRRKDSKKGWYIYYWTLKPENAERLLKKIEQGKKDALSDRIKKESGSGFYSCSGSCTRVDFENAFEMEFRCPECGEIMDMEDNTEKLRKMKKELKRMEEKI